MIDNEILSCIPKDVLFLLDKLNQHNYSAYIVGGAVRDLLLNRTPNDFDIATEAVPLEVEVTFDDFDCVKVGKKFGVIAITYNENQYEIATFRSDGIYEDSRHPSSVSYSRDIKDDLSRRDFTINALAFSPLTGVIDMFGGYEDLRKGIIRCIGNPDDRFNEDTLRILRAIRFAARYGFTIESKTLTSILSHIPDLTNISKERIHDELVQIFNSKYYTTIIKSISPVITWLLDDTSESTKNLLKTLPQLENYKLVLAYILRTKNILDAEAWLRRYKFSNDDIKVILNYIRLSDLLLYEDTMTEYNARKAMSIALDKDMVLDVLVMYGLDTAPYTNTYKSPCKIADLAINGEDVESFGYFGRAVGAILNKCLELVLREPNQNCKALLYKFIEKHGGDYADKF